MTSLNATSSASRTLAEPKPELSVLPFAGEWSTRRMGQWDWRLHPAYSFLLEPGGPDWTRLQDDPRAVQVKSNDGRHVYRVQLERGLLFAKVGLPPRKWHGRLRRRWSGTDAERECRVAAYAAKHGIETIRAIASAEAPAQGRNPTSILITVGLPSSEPLSDVWSRLDPDDRASRRIKNHIADEVARLLAHAHQNGFEHYDLHSGNVLLDALSPGRYRPLFVDLHSVATGRPVSDRGVIRNLAQFNQWFRLHATLTDRIRFLRRYLVWRDTLQGEGAYGRRLGMGTSELVRRLESAARKHANGLYAQRDRRVLRDGKYFTHIDLDDGWQAHVFLEAKHPVAGSRASEMVFTKDQWREWLRDPIKLVQPTSRRDLLKDSASATVCRASLPHPGGEIEVVCKRSTGKNPFKRFLGIFRRSRPMTTWHRANALLHRQIMTARPLAVLERRRFGVVLDSILVTERIENPIDLDTLLTVTMRNMPARRQVWLKANVIDKLARVVRQLLEV
jgi:Lipopolysaccharide kinase (Kdo/WaaP) family